MTTVAFLGPRGTFTEQAVTDFTAAGHLPGDAEHIPVSSPREALDMVRAGDADVACVALESSVDGPVTQTFDCFTTGDELQIIREHDVPVTFSVLVRPGTRPEDVKTLTCHPVAYNQISGWLGRNLPGVEFVAASSNGAGAGAVAAGTVDAAAAPARAGLIHGLEPLAEDVADIQDARTRFVLITRPRTPPAPTGHDRTSFVLRVPNRPSSLVQALMELSMRGVDMSRIESRPTREHAGTYDFHLEIVGHIEDAAVAEALAGLYRYCEKVRYLGSWPQEGWVGGVSGPSGSVPPDYSDSRRWIRDLRRGRLRRGGHLDPEAGSERNRTV
ncbi:prephenate dehydratase [Corynebacterium neomassiliense]|uniref:prephenate dehydratase n=1 Tax=Corynebacterium neomassiliense TaxID=2079482 RepID=UPI00102F57A5|nr:prephenate dehydratase [Corynebacterium neomassiliense]